MLFIIYWKVATADIEMLTIVLKWQLGEWLIKECLFFRNGFSLIPFQDISGCNNFFFFLRNKHTQGKGKGVLTQRHTTIPLKNHSLVDVIIKVKHLNLI